MSTYIFERVTTITHTITATADSFMEAQAKASVGGINRIKEKEGVEVTQSVEFTGTRLRGLIHNEKTSLWVVQVVTHLGNYYDVAIVADSEDQALYVAQNIGHVECVLKADLFADSNHSIESAHNALLEFWNESGHLSVHEGSMYNEAWSKLYQR